MKAWMEYRLNMEIVNLLSKLERFQGNWEKSQRIKPAFILSLMQTTIISSSGASTRIEGAILSDKEVEELFQRGCKITKISSRSEREVAGYIKALNYIYEHSDSLDISERTIRELHQLLTSELLEDQLPLKQRGSYKDVPNDVVERNLITGEEHLWIRTTPPGVQTTTEMRELIEAHRTAEKSKMNSAIKTAMFIVQLLAIHPFRDGNGRLSRLLTTLLLLKDYRWCRYVSHEKIIEDNKEAYYVALRKTQETLRMDHPDYDPWIQFFLNTVLKQANYLEEQIKIAQKDRPAFNLVGNEAKVYALIAKAGSLSSSEILKSLGISKDGLKKLLKRLHEKSVIEKFGAGTLTRYRVKE